MANMGFNPFARHAESQPSKPNGQGKSASAPEPQTATTDDTAGTGEKPPTRPIEEKPAPAARTSKAINPFTGHEGKKQFRLVRTQGTPPAQKLLNWLRHDWPHDIIHLRDFCRHGPVACRNRENAIAMAEVLVGHGWLVPIEAKYVRRDTKWWRVVRGPNDYPTIAGVTVNAAITKNVAPNVAIMTNVASNDTTVT
jgi:hypothetical protein